MTEAEKNRERFFTLKQNLAAMTKRVASMEDDLERTVGVTKENLRPPGQAVTPQILADFNKFEKG